VTAVSAAGLIFVQTTEFGIKLALVTSLVLSCALVPHIDECRRCCRSVQAAPGGERDPLGGHEWSPLGVAGGIKMISCCSMPMTLRLTDEEQAALRERAQREGISMQDAARRAVRDYIARGAHRDRVATAAEDVMMVHAEALRRLGE